MLDKSSLCGLMALYRRPVSTWGFGAVPVSALGWHWSILARVLEKPSQAMSLLSRSQTWKSWSKKLQVEKSTGFAKLKSIEKHQVSNQQVSKKTGAPKNIEKTSIRFQPLKINKKKIHFCWSGSAPDAQGSNPSLVSSTHFSAEANITLPAFVPKPSSTQTRTLTFKSSLIFPFSQGTPLPRSGTSNSTFIFIYLWLLPQQQVCIWQPCRLGLGSSVRAASWWVWPCRLQPAFPYNRVQEHRRVAGSSRSFNFFSPFPTDSANKILPWFAICPRHPSRY